VVSKIYLDFIPSALVPFQITGRVPVMQDIQVRIYSVQISRNDGETETQFHPTRIEAEAAANQILARSDGSTVKEIKIFSVP
jgi:hypothetical protein